MLCATASIALEKYAEPEKDKKYETIVRKWQVYVQFQRMLFLTSLNQGYHKPVIEITYLVKGFIVFFSIKKQHEHRRMKFAS